MNITTRNGITLKENTWYEDQSDELDGFFGDLNQSFLDCLSDEGTRPEQLVYALDEFLKQHKIPMIAVIIEPADPPAQDDMYKWQFAASKG